MDDRRRELIEQNTHLVDRVVHQLAPRLPRHLDRSELNANGLLGLTEAAERFDFDAGVPFFAFALHRIRGAVMDAARATDYLPSRVRALHRRVSDATNEHRGRTGEAPSDEELAATLLVEPIDLRRLRDRVAQGPAYSLDSGTATDRPMSELVIDLNATGPEEHAEDQELLQALRSAIARLPERHRIALTATFLEGRSGLQVSKLLGVSPSRVSQLRADALSLLREAITIALDGPTPTDGADDVTPSEAAGARM